MIKKIILGFLFSTLLFSEEITIYTECDHKPYSYCENDEVKGISIDIYKAIFSKIEDYSLKIKGIAHKEGHQKMKEGNILIMGNMPYRPKKPPYIKDYSKAFVHQKKSLYCNKNFQHQNITWPQDFHGLSIATLTEDTIDKTLHQIQKEGLIKFSKDTHANNIIKLIEEKIDCYLIDTIRAKGSLLQMQKKHKENKQTLRKIKNIKEVISVIEQTYHLGFSNKNFPLKKDLIKKINLAIRVITHSKEIDAIIQRNFNVYLQPEKKEHISIALYNWGDNLVSDKLNGYGMIPEIVTSAFLDRNIEVKYHFYDYRYAYLLTKWGKECMSLPWLRIGDRERYMEFSDNIIPTSIYFFYNKELYPKGINYQNKKDFKHYRIGGISGYFYEKEYFSKVKTIDYKSFKNFESAIEALLSKKIDVLIAQENNLKKNLKQFLPSERHQIVQHQKPIQKLKNYAIFSKNCKNAKQFKDAFNLGFKNIKNNGIFEEILKKYNVTIDIYYNK